MSQKKATTKGGRKGKAEGSKGQSRKREPTLAKQGQQTARELIALLSDARLPSSVYAALASELNDFAARVGGVTSPAVLFATYPAICEAAGFDALTSLVAALKGPAPAPEQSAPVFEFEELQRRGEVLSEQLNVADDSLAHMRIFKYDRIKYESAASIARRKHSPQIDSGDPIVLKVKRPREGEPEVLFGEVRFEPGKVVLVSHQPGRERRAFNVRDVIVLGRIEQVWRCVRRPYYIAGGDE